MSDSQLPPVPTAPVPPPVPADAPQAAPVTPRPAAPLPATPLPVTPQPAAPLPITEESHSLPLIALPFLIFNAAKGLVPFLIFLVISGRGGDFFMQLIGLAMLVPAMLSAIVRFFAFSYRLEPEELVIRDGVLTRQVRSVPYSRIQNVDLVQNLVHRALGVAVVRLETASGGKPEAVIHVLTLPAVHQLRSQILHGKSSSSAAVDPVHRPVAAGEAEVSPPNRPGRKLLTMEVKRLGLLGLLSNRGLLVVAAAFGVLQQVGLFDNFLGIPSFAPWEYGAFGSLENTLQEVKNTGEAPPQAGADLMDGVQSWIAGALDLSWTPVAAGLAIFGLLLLLVVVTRLLSAVWVMVTLYDFQLRRDHEDLRTEYGLLTKITASVPRRRIQLLSIHESFLRRRLGLASVQIETAGGGDGEDSSPQGPGAARLWLAPLIERAKLVPLIREVAPQLDFEGGRLDFSDLPWQPLAANAQRRLIRRSLLWIALVMAIVYATLGLWALLAIPLIPLALVHARLFTRNTGVALTSDAILYRSGAWGLQTSVVPFAKIQGLRVKQSPFDRRNRMASLSVDTAGANLNRHRVDVGYLNDDQAQHLVERLRRETADLEFQW